MGRAGTAARTGLEALEPRQRAAASRWLPGGGAGQAGDAEVHPHRSALRPGGSAAPAPHGVRPPHAQKPHRHNVAANQAGLRSPHRGAVDVDQQSLRL